MTQITDQDLVRVRFRREWEWQRRAFIIGGWMIVLGFVVMILRDVDPTPRATAVMALLLWIIGLSRPRW